MRGGEGRCFFTVEILAIRVALVRLDMVRMRLPEDANCKFDNISSHQVRALDHGSCSTRSTPTKCGRKYSCPLVGGGRQGRRRQRGGLAVGGRADEAAVACARCKCPAAAFDSMGSNSVEARASLG